MARLVAAALLAQLADLGAEPLELGVLVARHRGLAGHRGLAASATRASSASAASGFLAPGTSGAGFLDGGLAGRRRLAGLCSALSSGDAAGLAALLGHRSVLAMVSAG